MKNIIVDSVYETKNIPFVIQYGYEKTVGTDVVWTILFFGCIPTNADISAKAITFEA